MIRELRNRVNELNEAISGWERQISGLQSHIDEARAEICAKTDEIERLEAEAHRTELISQLTEALNTMNVEQLADLVSTLQNGETPTIQPAPETDHPTVTVEEHCHPALQYVDVSTRWGDVRVDIPADRPDTWLTSEEFDALPDLSTEMSDADMTLVGVRHQELFGIHNYVPKIGEIVRLEKETPTSNCYGVLVASEINTFEEDQAIGILPTVGGDKALEVINDALPCVCHQDMWDNPDLNEFYEITGVVVGRYVTIRKVESVTPATEEEIEEESSSSNFNVLNGHALTEDEARELFNNQTNDDCQIINVDLQNNQWIIEYDNHRRNRLEDMRETVVVNRH